MLSFACTTPHKARSTCVGAVGKESEKAETLPVLNADLMGLVGRRATRAGLGSVVQTADVGGLGEETQEESAAAAPGKVQHGTSSHLYDLWISEIDTMPEEKRKRFMSLYADLKHQLAEGGCYHANGSVKREKLSTEDVKDSIARPEEGEKEERQPSFPVEESAQPTILKDEQANNPLIIALRERSDLQDLAQLALKVQVYFSTLYPGCAHTHP